MRALNSASVMSEPKSRPWLCGLFIAVSLVCSVYFIATTTVGGQYAKGFSIWNAVEKMKNVNSNKCKIHCKPFGSETLPEGIVTKTSNFEMRPLWSSSLEDEKSKPPMNLLAIAAGIKQKEVVNQIVRKFPSGSFIVMVFHYDGMVDQWKDLSWSASAIHVSAPNQTKWWFAKRFLHPDIVAEYDYIFLWDEDLGVENFNPRGYLSVVKDEGLEISQPALDPVKSTVHHPITSRKSNSRVHRRMYKFKGTGRCDDKSTSPPCIGWVEMMAPVFSRAAWRCVWYMIQNDLIHAWGLDMQLGYCAQGDRTKNVGVVDSEFVVHLGLPTLGVFNATEAPSKHQIVDSRPEVRRQSFVEMQVFKKRWKNAAEEDRCWVDPYQRVGNQTEVFSTWDQQRVGGGVDNDKPRHHN